MTMKKRAFLALLLTASVALGLAGCSQGASSTAPEANKNTAQNIPLNNNQSDQTQQADQAGNNSNNTPTDPYANDASIQEVRQAYNIGSDYMTITPVSISGIALGKMEMPIDKDQQLVLAKAMFTAISNSGWQQGDPPPGLFVSRDGSAFSVGMKKKNGDLTLETYQYQSDKTYKSVKKQSKKS